MNSISSEWRERSEREVLRRGEEITMKMRREDAKKGKSFDEPEYMLSQYHKEEMIGWVLQRLDWIKVVLVANRSDNMDSLLLDSARKQLSASATCVVKQYLRDWGGGGGENKFCI
jgi:hypothetical protein